MTEVEGEGEGEGEGVPWVSQSSRYIEYLFSWFGIPRIARKFSLSG
jgi:hypothetical protein